MAYYNSYKPKSDKPIFYDDDMFATKQIRNFDDRNMVAGNSLVPYAYNSSPPAKKSMSFLTTQELFSYRAIPAIGVVAYIGSAIGAIAHHDTFESWFGSEYTAINVLNTLTATSIFGTACYIYGRRHVRHSGAFQRVVYPVYGSIIFNCASHFNWALIKELLKDQKVFDNHWKCIAGILSGLTFMYVGRSYLKFVDQW